MQKIPHEAPVASHPAQAPIHIDLTNATSSLNDAHPQLNPIQPIKTPLTRSELKTIIILALISGLRMFGFFMLLPVFKNLAQNLNHSSSTLIGLAMGIYGLLQAFFYLPLGVISDKIGRKPVIFFGLGLLLTGSLVAAHAESIYTLIFARALQGLGAISAVLTALMADSIRSEQQSKGLMAVGMMVGLSFPLSLMLAPILLATVAYQGFFYSLAALTLAALISAFFLPAGTRHPYYNRNDFITALKTAAQPLRKTMLGVFFLHALSMIFFFLAPHFLSNILKTASANQWQIYLPILFLSFLAIAPLMRKRMLQTHLSQILFILAYVILIAALWAQKNTFIYIGLVIYFMAFNYLEVMQPSHIAKYAPKHLKGSVMGVYYMLQSLGMFTGALIAGIAEKYIDQYLEIQKLADVSYLKASQYFILFFTLSAFFVLIWVLIDQFSNTKNKGFL